MKCYTIVKIVHAIFDQGKLQYTNQDVTKGKATTSIMMAVHDRTVEPQTVNPSPQTNEKNENNEQK